MVKSLFGNQDTFVPNYYRCNKCEAEYDGPVLEARDRICQCGGTAFSRIPKLSKPLPELRSNRKPNSVTHDESEFASYEDGETPHITHTRTPPSHKSQMVVSVVIIAVIAVIVIAILSLFNKTPGVVEPVAVIEQAPAEVVVQPQPIAEPVVVSPQDVVDVKSVSRFGPVQYVMIGLLLIIALCGYLDRRQSNQAYDALVAIFLALVVVWFGSFPFIRAFFSAIELVNPSLIIVLVSLAIVITTALTGGVDFSPIGIFFGVIAIFGGVLINDLGSLQDVFNIPSGSLLTMPTLFDLMAAKQWELARFSMIVYGCLSIALIAYGYEILRPSETRETSAGGILISLVGVGIFVSLRAFATDVPVVNTVGGAFMVVVIYNFIIATIMRERLSGSGVNWAEYKLGLVKLVSPWDVFAFQAIVGALLVMAIGKI